MKIESNMRAAATHRLSPLLLCRASTTHHRVFIFRSTTTKFFFYSLRQVQQIGVSRCFIWSRLVICWSRRKVHEARLILPNLPRKTAEETVPAARDAADLLMAVVTVEVRLLRKLDAVA